ncbi:MAG: serine protease [Actinobacteria bacterium]|nr:serine protease [Actinomycetota bacterium]
MATDSGKVRDWVVPIGAIRADNEHATFEFRGTGFALEGEARMITAAHVVHGLTAQELGFLTVREGAWTVNEILHVQTHPEEDIAKLDLVGPLAGSPLVANPDWQGSAMPYTMWGYPMDAQYDIVVDGLAHPRPDLVFTAGHVRRRVSHPVEEVTGQRLLELGTAAGRGCSGSPVLRDPGWQVVGVYISERHNEAEGIRVGYAVRMADVIEWVST